MVERLTALTPILTGGRRIRPVVPPVELPPEPPPIEPLLEEELLEPLVLPQTPDELFSLLETTLPELTIHVGMTREEAIPLAIETLERNIQENPENIVRRLRDQGRTPEGEILLQILGAEREDIDLIFGEEEEPFIEPPPPPVEQVFVELDGIRQLVIRTEDNSLYDRNGNWVGYYDFLEQKVFNPYKAEGLGEKALNSFTAGIGDVLSTGGGAARWLGFEDVGEKLSTAGTQLQKFGVPSSSFEVFDLLNPEFYATKIARTIPFALSLAPLGIGGFYGGVALATSVGMGTVWSLIVGGLSGAALSRPLESAMEAGSQYDDAISRGKTEKEAKEEADEVFRNNLTLAGADAFEIALALAPTPKWVPASLVKSGLARTFRIGGKMVIVGLTEGGEEVYQDLIQRRARDEEFKLDPVSKEVFAIGFVMGAGMGLGGDVISSIVNNSRNDMSVIQRKEFDGNVKEFQADGFNLSESQLKALDITAQTPEGNKIVQDAINESKVAEEAVIPTPAVLTQQIWDTLPVSDRSLLAKQAGLESEVGSKAWEDLTSQEQDAIRLAREEIAPVVTPEVTPVEVVPEVPKIEPVEGVAVPATDLQETMPPEVITEPVPPVAEETINVHDVNVIDRFRPTRFVFDKMGLFDIWESTFEAETLKAEAQVEFNKELNKHAKAVGKDKVRRELLWEFVNNSNQEVFKQLTFEEKQAALWWKRTADDWADRLNIPQEQRIKDYIPHIFDEQALQAKDSPMDSSLSMVFSKKITDKVKMPFLEKRLGKELGLVKDPFLAAQAYQNIALRKFYYEPILQKLKLVGEHESTPQFARNYLKEYSKRMTGEPAGIDREINKAIQDIANSVRGLPGGESLANFLEQGNPSGMAAYNLTSALYVMWLGFKPTTAIRNLSQHGLIIADVDSIQDFGNGIRLRFTEEGKAAVAESLVWRSRRGAFIESIDSSMAAEWTDAVRETALFLFRKADEQNVKDAFLSGYAEAKRLYPEAGRELWIKRGDEVARDTQYLYTKMNSLAISQNGPGKVGAMLTTWAINWLELMNKFVRGRPSKVYIDLVEQSDGRFTLPKKNWLQTRKSLLVYMAIVGLAYALKEQDWNRVKAFEYTGFTSIRTFGNLAGGEFPALQLPGAVADLITGITLGDDRKTTTAWNELKRSFSILNQVERVASGERDWLSLLFYLEGKNHQVRELKEDWESNWKPYDDLTDQAVRAKEFPTLSLSASQKKWREQNPKIEAQMFITNRLGTLSSDEARDEVLRLIDKHDIDTDVINGYEKIFGVDTVKELDAFQKRIGNLEKFTIGEEAEYFTTANFLSEVNKMVKVQGRDKVERDGQALAVFLLGEQDSWQPYEDYDNADARRLYRQQFPDVEASLYLVGKIGAFENPESAKILLQTMDKFNIPPSAVRAFNENPDKYDELFTRKFELEQKNFELTTQFENFGNSEADNFIEDRDERKLAREKFKEDNPAWVADQRRIEAIDNDADNKTIEAWVDRGRVIDEFNASSSEAQSWLLGHPDVHKWALDNKLLEDDGSTWNTDVIRLQVKWRKTDEQYDALPVEGERREGFLLSHPEYNDDRRRRTMFGLDAPELVETFVDYGHVVDRFSSGSSQAKLFRLDHPELSRFGESEDTLGWEELDKENEPIWRIDVKFESEDNAYQAILDKFEDNIKQTEATDAYLLAHPEYHRKRFERDALRLEFPRVDEYVEWYTSPTVERPADLDKSLPFYEDDWYLMEHPKFYQAMLNAELFTKRRDFRLVPMKNGKPDRVVGRKYIEYLNIKFDQASRDQFRMDNPDLDEWGVSVGIWTRTMDEKRRRLEQTLSERFREDIAGRTEERRETLEEIQERLRELSD